MITLYLYPSLFGLPDNNPFGLKVDTFLRLVGLDYTIEHILDTSKAPRQQLPYLIDNGETVSDSNSMIRFLIDKYQLHIDDNLTSEQRMLHQLINRMLDEHLYWVMSYSRWQDERFWPSFKSELLKQSLGITEQILEQAKNYNCEKYHYQGIGRYSIDAIYQSGIDDLTVIRDLLSDKPFLFGNEPHCVDASCYGFLANSYYFDIDTPLKQFIIQSPRLAAYIERIRNKLDY